MALWSAVAVVCAMEVAGGVRDGGSRRTSPRAAIKPSAAQVGPSRGRSHSLMSNVVSIHSAPTASAATPSTAAAPTSGRRGFSAALADASKRPAGEKTEKVAGHHYEKIVAGADKGHFINRTGIPAMARTSRSSSAAGAPSTFTTPPRTTRSTSFRTPPRRRQARRRTRAERPPPESTGGLLPPQRHRSRQREGGEQLVVAHVLAHLRRQPIDRGLPARRPAERDREAALAVGAQRLDDDVLRARDAALDRDLLDRLPSGSTTRPLIVTLPLRLESCVTSMRRKSLSRSERSLPICAW